MAALQFFQNVQKGAEKGQTGSNATMTGISSLSIAIDLLAGSEHRTISSITSEAKKHDETLTLLLDQSTTIDNARLDSLINFLRQLEVQGNVERDAVISIGQEPQNTPQLRMDR